MSYFQGYEDQPTVVLTADLLRVGEEKARQVLWYIPEWWIFGWNALREEVISAARDLDVIL